MYPGTLIPFFPVQLHAVSYIGLCIRDVFYVYLGRDPTLIKTPFQHAVASPWLIQLAVASVSRPFFVSSYGTSSSIICHRTPTVV